MPLAVAEQVTTEGRSAVHYHGNSQPSSDAPGGRRDRVSVAATGAVDSRMAAASPKEVEPHWKPQLFTASLAEQLAQEGAEYPFALQRFKTARKQQFPFAVCALQARHELAAENHGAGLAARAAMARAASSNSGGTGEPRPLEISLTY